MLPQRFTGNILRYCNAAIGNNWTDVFEGRFGFKRPVVIEIGYFNILCHLKSVYKI